MPFLFDWATLGNVNGSTTITDGPYSTLFTSTEIFADFNNSPLTQYSTSFDGTLRTSNVGPGDFTGTRMDFGTAVKNVSFEILDLDANGGTNGWDDQVTVRAFDADGNELPVTFSNLEAYHVQTGTNTVEANGNSSTGVEGPGAADSITVSISGLISRIEVQFQAGSSGLNSGVIGLGDISGQVVCFARGMLIDTPDGKVKVEDLQAGDQVTTMDRGPQTVRWIGSRTVQATGAFAPIVIGKNTMGNTDDLIVSPQHRIMVSGWQAELMFGEAEVLVPAKHLTGLDNVYARDGGEIEYFHILFDQHEIIFAQGVPSESFHPGILGLDGMGADQRAEIYSLFPELEANPAGFGPAARGSLSSVEGRALAKSIFL